MNIEDLKREVKADLSQFRNYTREETLCASVVDKTIDYLASRGYLPSVKRTPELDEAIKFFEEGVKAWKLSGENPHSVLLFEAARAYAKLQDGETQQPADAVEALNAARRLYEGAYPADKIAYDDLLIVERTLTQPKQEWLPIDTAPKDGTLILLCDSYSVEKARWHNGVWSIRRCSDPFYDEEWDENTPNHWMPLPTPPQKGD